LKPNREPGFDTANAQTEFGSPFALNMTEIWAVGTKSFSGRMDTNKPPAWQPVNNSKTKIFDLIKHSLDKDVVGLRVEV